MYGVIREIAMLVDKSPGPLTLEGVFQTLINHFKEKNPSFLKSLGFLTPAPEPSPEVATKLKIETPERISREGQFNVFPDVNAVRKIEGIVRHEYGALTVQGMHYYIRCYRKLPYICLKIEDFPRVTAYAPVLTNLEDIGLCEARSTFFTAKEQNALADHELETCRKLLGILYQVHPDHFLEEKELLDKLKAEKDKSKHA